MKRILLIVVTTFTCLCGCDRKDLGPDPAFGVVGSYSAIEFRQTPTPQPYPINGKTINIDVIRTANSTVNVTVQAPANGIYSPGNLTYTGAHVSVNKNGKNEAVSWAIYLNGKVTEELRDVILVYPNKTADYFFVPPDYTKGPVTTRLRMN